MSRVHPRRLAWFMMVVVGLAAWHGAMAGDFQNGDVIAGVAGGTYSIYDSSGVFQESISDGLFGFTTGCATNPDGSLLYTTNIVNDRIIVYDVVHPHNIAQVINTAAQGGDRNESIVFDAAGNFYVGNAGFSSNDIQKYNAAGVFQTSFNVAVETLGSDWIELAVDQKTIFYTSEGTRVMRYDVSTSTQLADFANLPGGQNFALRLLPPFDGSGGLIVANRESIRRLNGAGTIVQTYDVAGEEGWFSMNLDPDGTSFWAGDFGTGNFYKFDITSGAVLIGPINAGPPNTLFGLCVIGEITGATSTLTLAPSDDVNPTGTEHTVTATVIGGDGNPAAGVLVNFQVVSGPNSGTAGTCSVNADCTTDASGQVSFTYLGDGGVGEDAIVATIMNEAGEPISATARKTWEPPPCIDKDGDGFGDPGDASCPGGSEEDCDDADPDNYPGNTEVCDGQDNDCDVLVDEGFDADGDGIADCFDDCPLDPDNDIDGDGVCGDVDNCPDDPNPDQTDFNGDGVGDVCTPCEPDPRSQGYWHRQCLGVPADEGGIDPGRHGRGPQEPLEFEFVKNLMGPVSALLQDLMFENGGSCAGGMDANPANDHCERAIKQTTAVLFNLASSKLSGSCEVDLSAEGCGSGNLLELVDELAALINSADRSNCRTAAACAAAVNEGTALVESTVVTADVLDLAQPVQDATGSTTTGGGDAPEAATVALPIESADVPLPSVPVVTIAPLVQETPEAMTPEPEAVADEDDFQTLQRHLAVLANASAPEKALQVSTDALLTALSGGYDPEVRLEIVKGLLGRIDVAYHALLVGHLEEIRAEAKAFEKADLVREATRLLVQVEPSLE